jgi:hypothetical protein
LSHRKLLGIISLGNFCYESAECLINLNLTSVWMVVCSILYTTNHPPPILAGIYFVVTGTSRDSCNTSSHFR